MFLPLTALRFFFVAILGPTKHTICGIRVTSVGVEKPCLVLCDSDEHVGVGKQGVPRIAVRKDGVNRVLAYGASAPRQEGKELIRYL